MQRIKTYTRRLGSHKYKCFLLILMVLFFNSLSEQGLFLSSLKDASHALVFGLTTYLLLIILLKKQTALKYVLLVCFLSFLGGLFVEIIQPYFGRSRSVLDLYNDFAGCCSAGVFYWSKLQKSSRAKFLYRLLAFVFVMSSFVVPAKHVMVLAKRGLSVPVLANFDREWEGYIRLVQPGAKLSVQPAPDHWQNETWVGRIEFNEGYSYPGISFPYIYPDWSKYSLLSFKVFSLLPDSVLLSFRVNDRFHQNQYHDRFNLQLEVRSGLNEFEFKLDDIKRAPIKRDMDMAAIDSMTFFMVKPKHSISLYFDDVVLK